MTYITIQTIIPTWGQGGEVWRCMTEKPSHLGEYAIATVSKIINLRELNDLVKAIGLLKEKLCTHCWDGSSYF